MYQVIARKYRPQSFNELVGQEHVRSTLTNAINGGRIAHGYIFSGQRGTGKTTVARILARCLNCEKGPTDTPCLQCAACVEISNGASIDVIEIDAASNRGINEMRELRENVRFRPARDRFKVFIIDEAHQITTEAFNALLKTLEEPPEWAVFVLCTTEAHKIPTTIASRCQQFSFRSVEFPELVDRMRWICTQEGIEAEEEALAVLAQAGEGSVRDSLSALDQAIACCGTKLEGAQVRELLGVFSLDRLAAVAKAVLAADRSALLSLVYELERNGAHLQHYARELSRYFRNLLVARQAGVPTRLIGASPAEQEKLAAMAREFSDEDLMRYLQITLDLYRELQYSLQPRLHLELGLLRLAYASRLVTVEEALASLGGAAPAAPKTSPPQQPPPEPPPAPRTAPAANAPLREKLTAYLTGQNLKFLLDAAEHAEVSEAPGELRFTAPKEFGMAIRSAEMREAVAKAAGKPLRIVFHASENAATQAASPAPPPDDDEVTREALAHPDVRKFQQTFPGSHVRTVRNLRD